MKNQNRCYFCKQIINENDEEFVIINLPDSVLEVYAHARHAGVKEEFMKQQSIKK